MTSKKKAATCVAALQALRELELDGVGRSCSLTYREPLSESQDKLDEPN